MFPADWYFYFITVTAENTALYTQEKMAKETPELFQNVSSDSVSDPSQVTKQFFYKTWNNSKNNF